MRDYALAIDKVVKNKWLLTIEPSDKGVKVIVSDRVATVVEAESPKCWRRAVPKAVDMMRRI